MTHKKYSDLKKKKGKANLPGALPRFMEHSERVEDWDFLGVISIEKLHKDLTRKLEVVERAIARKQYNNEQEYASADSLDLSTCHLVTTRHDCRCIWCKSEKIGAYKEEKLVIPKGPYKTKEG